MGSGDLDARNILHHTHTTLRVYSHQAEAEEKAKMMNEQAKKIKERESIPVGPPRQRPSTCTETLLDRDLLTETLQTDPLDRDPKTEPLGSLSVAPSHFK